MRGPLVLMPSDKRKGPDYVELILQGHCGVTTLTGYTTGAALVMEDGEF